MTMISVLNFDSTLLSMEVSLLSMVLSREFISSRSDSIEPVRSPRRWSTCSYAPSSLLTRSGMVVMAEILIGQKNSGSLINRLAQRLLEILTM